MAEGAAKDVAEMEDENDLALISQPERFRREEEGDLEIVEHEAAGVAGAIGRGRMCSAIEIKEEDAI